MDSMAHPGPVQMLDKDPGEQPMSVLDEALIALLKERLKVELDYTRPGRYDGPTLKVKVLVGDEVITESQQTLYGLEAR